MASHTKIESNPTLSKLNSTSLSESDYCSILEGYFGFFSALESKFSSHSAHQSVPVFHDRLRTNRLRSDLLALGKTENELAAIPSCAELPSIETESQFLGVMYVTEGSTLGGMLIAKHLRSLPFFSNERATFFSDDPQTVSSRWKSFIDHLETRSAALDESATLASASETFQKLDRWMEKAVRTSAT